MPEETDESVLAAAIASLGSKQFPNDLHAWLQRVLNFDNITMLAYFPKRKPSLLMAAHHRPQVHAAMEGTYLTGAYLLDPFYQLHVNRAPSGMYRLSDVAPDKFRGNQYYLDYYLATTLVDEIAFVSYPSPGVTLQICLGRDIITKTRFPSRELAAAHRIAPIMTSLTCRHWRDLASVEETANTETTGNLIEVMRTSRNISLSPRQAEVAMLVLQGHSSVSIGLRLQLSPQTVKVFRKQLYKKCGISSQSELFRLMLPLLGTVSDFNLKSISKPASASPRRIPARSGRS